MSKLYIVATPIGNLEDISIRALRVLGEVDFILCEDTRVTRVLLDRYDIKTKTISFHQHSEDKKIEKLLDILSDGKDLALVSDAGTPGISDPGGKLVQAAIEKLGDNVSVESVPGPSAVTAALSISGIPTDKFVFLGFPPHKKGRLTFVEKIFESDLPVVVYESKHRIIKFLEELKKHNEEVIEYNKKLEMQYPQKKDKDNKRKSTVSSVVVCRELSKMHETVYRGEIDSILTKIKNNKDDQRGEFVVIVGK